MGYSYSGGAGTAAHKHTSAASDGGPLKAANGANTTVFNIGSSATEIKLEALI